MTAKRFIQVIDGVKDTRTGRVLTHPLEITLKLNEINDLYDYVFNRNEHLEKENEQLKKEISIFEGEDAGHYQRWVAQIKKYVDESNPNFEYDEDFIIKIALSYTLQSLRNGESLKRFQWEYKELEE